MFAGKYAQARKNIENIDWYKWATAENRNIQSKWSPVGNIYNALGTSKMKNSEQSMYQSIDKNINNAHELCVDIKHNDTHTREKMNKRKTSMIQAETIFDLLQFEHQTHITQRWNRNRERWQNNICIRIGRFSFWFFFFRFGSQIIPINTH